MAGPSRRARAAVFAGLLALGAWACSDPSGPGTEPFCADRPDAAVVEIADPNLDLAIRANLGVSPLADLTCGMVEGITTLNAANRGIVSIEGIENLTGLTVLQIRANAITDIGPLSGLTGLTSLNVAANQIHDVEPLRGLTQLSFLAINENQLIEDIDALSGLTSLTGTLWMHSNAIVDLGPLRGLSGISILRAYDNAIADLTPLSALSGLTEVHVHINSLRDTGGLVALGALTAVSLHSNPELTDIQDLIDNPGLGPGTDVNLAATSVSCADVDLLNAKGVSVISDCP